MLSDDKSLPCRRCAERRDCAPVFGVSLVKPLDGGLFGAMDFVLTAERTVFVLVLALVLALALAFALAAALRDGFLASLLVALAPPWDDVARVAFRAGFLAAFLAIFLVTFLPAFFVVRLRDFAAAFIFDFSRFTISPFGVRRGQYRARRPADSVLANNDTTPVNFHENIPAVREYLLNRSWDDDAFEPY